MNKKSKRPMPAHVAEFGADVRRIRRRRIGMQAAAWVGALLGPMLATAQAPSEPRVTLHYIQRPPYMVAQGDGLVGLTGGPTYQAFKQANVPVHIEETSFARQLRTLKDNTGWDCMIGMFWKAEREEFGRYSKPVYQDQPQLILAAASSQQRFSGHTS
ncbi:MAG: hypothetical protein ACK520_13740, partial [Inhella sp.]